MGLLGASSPYTDWYIGLTLSFIVIVVVVIIVAIILTLAARIADQAAQAAAGVDTVRAQTTSLANGVDKVNDSAVRILHMARSLRKVAVGK
jgi:X-X-X-Leu-X-X-Gly heptad repeat protein